MSLAFSGTGSVTLTTKYEILIPISTSRAGIELVQRTDDNIWHQGQKIAGTIADNLVIEIKLAIRIHRSLLGSLVTFLENNYNETFTITATGYDLFDDDNKGLSNNVRLNGFQSPVREQTNWYRLDLNMVKV